MLKRLALRKTSLIDFPGRVASVLFFPGCDFRCPYCHNAGLVLHPGEEPFVDGEDDSCTVDEILDFLKKRAGLVTGVVLSGGEALIHDELPAMARRIASFGLKIKLDTNGSFPERMADIRADYVALDLKTAPSRYDAVAPGMTGAGALVLESLHRLRSSGRAYEVRITCAPGLVGTSDIDAMAAVLDPRDDVVLQPFRPGGCLDPAWDAMEGPGEAEMLSWLERLKAVAPKARIRGLGHHQRA